MQAPNNNPLSRFSGEQQPQPDAWFGPDGRPVDLGYGQHPQGEHDVHDDTHQESWLRRFGHGVREFGSNKVTRYTALGVVAITAAGVAVATPKGKDTLDSFTGFFAAQSKEDIQYKEPLPPPNCLSTAFTIAIDARAPYRQEIEIIEGTAKSGSDPVKINGARQAAAKDLTFTPDASLLVRGIFTNRDDVYLQQLPDLNDPKQYASRYPNGVLQGNVPFAFCLKKGKNMGDAITQLSSKHFKINMDSFVVNPIDTKEVNEGYEVVYDLPEKNEYSFKTGKEIARELAELSPGSKCDLAKRKCTVTKTQNERYMKVLKAAVYNEISSMDGEYGKEFQEIARKAIAQQIEKALKRKMIFSIDGVATPPSQKLTEELELSSNGQPETIEFFDVAVTKFEPVEMSGAAS